MVNSPNFQLYKMRRAIMTLGENFTFTRDILDDNREPTGETQQFIVKGIYHEHYEGVFLRQTTRDASVIRSKSSPQITCLWDDSLVLKNTDTVMVNNHSYKIGEIKNLVEASIVAAISLEVIDDGSARS